MTGMSLAASLTHSSSERTLLPTAVEEMLRYESPTNMVARITREPMGSIKNWSSGRHRAPRAVLRLLALYRLTRRLAAPAAPPARRAPRP